MSRHVGRPRNVENRDLVDLDECLRRMARELRMEVPPISRRTLQNRLSAGRYTRYGLYHKPEVDWNEVQRDLHWKRKRVS